MMRNKGKSVSFECKLALLPGLNRVSAYSDYLTSKLFSFISKEYETSFSHWKNYFWTVIFGYDKT